MTTEQMMEAIKALCPDAAIRYSASVPDWYVSLPNLEVKDGNMLQSIRASGTTPEGAVAAAWARLTAVKHPKQLVVDVMNEKRRYVRWNGFMWADDGD